MGLDTCDGASKTVIGSYHNLRRWHCIRKILRVPVSWIGWCRKIDSTGVRSCRVWGDNLQKGGINFLGHLICIAWCNTYSRNATRQVSSKSCGAAY